MLLFDDYFDNKTFTCNQIKSGEYNLYMQYSSSSEYNQSTIVKINNEEHLINIPNDYSNKSESVQIGLIDIVPNTDGILHINSNIINKIEQKNPRKPIKDFPNGLMKCNTFWKLQSSSFCKKYGKYIDDTYFL